MAQESAAAAVAETQAAEDKTGPVQPRKLPEVDPAMVRVNYAGQSFKEIFVRLPMEFMIGDLAEPGIWRRIQSDRDRALAKLDRVVMVTPDEGTMYVAYVAEVSPVAATLSKPQVVQLVSRLPSQFSDPLYRIEWRDGGYAVVRKKDKHIMASGFQSEGSAIMALNQLYGRRA